MKEYRLAWKVAWSNIKIAAAWGSKSRKEILDIVFEENNSQQEQAIYWIEERTV